MFLQTDCRTENKTQTFKAISTLNTLASNDISVTAFYKLLCDLNTFIFSPEIVTYSGNPSHFLIDPFKNEPGVFSLHLL